MAQIEDTTRKNAPSPQTEVSWSRDGHSDAFSRKGLIAAFVVFVTMALLLALGLGMITSAKIATPLRSAAARADAASDTGRMLSEEKSALSELPEEPPAGGRLDVREALDVQTETENQGNHFFRQQCFWIFLGLIVCVIGCFVSLDRLYAWSHWGILAISLPLAYLAAAYATGTLFGMDKIHLFPLVKAIKGAVRWFHFGGFQLQPSEFAKVFLVVFLAAYYGRIPKEKLRTFWHGIAIPLATVGVPTALVFFGKDLSSTAVIGTMILGMVFFAGARVRYVVALCVIALALGVYAVAGSPMRRARIVAWQHPEEAKDNESYQLYQSQLCLGVGSLTGVGFAKGYMKTYLPEPHTDFIVAVLGEEFGFLGVMFLLLVYMMMCGAIVVIGSQARLREDLLLCEGIAMLIGTQVFFNIGVVSGFLPPTGVTAPFLSYGGSSVLSLMFLLGLAINVSRRANQTMWKEISEQRYSSILHKSPTRRPEKHD